MKRVIVAVTLLMYCWAGQAPAAEEPSPETPLLKDFRPRFVYRIPVTEIVKARYPVIDMHAHVYVRTPEQLDRWVQVVDEHGIAKAIVLTGTTGKQFDDLCTLYAKYPDRFQLWCGFDYTGYNQPGFGPAAVAELQRCYDMGARGIGELGDKGKGLFYCRPTKAWGVHLDNPRMDPLLTRCAEVKMPINIHVADPCWLFYAPARPAP